VTLDDVARFLHHGEPMPRGSVAVTFDDGYLDNAEVAAPILDRLGIRAVFYVTVTAIENGAEPWFCRLRRAFHRDERRTWVDPRDGAAYGLADPAARRRGFLAACAWCATLVDRCQDDAVRSVEEQLGSPSTQPGSPPLMMTWDHARELHARGHSIGSHTLSHPNMAQIAEAEALREFRDSRAILERELGAPVVHFSYPNPILDPHWNPRTVELSGQCGYRTAVTSTEGPVTAASDPLALKRVAVPVELQQFRWVLERTLAFSR
jgi:peptidoglycan/xylan/chitin deacetylase (PgdA/CDA1 family)